MKVYSSTRTRRETLYQRTRDARGSGAGARAQGQGLAVAAAPEACRCSAATCLREGSLPSPHSRVERTWPTGRRIGGTIRGVLAKVVLLENEPTVPLPAEQAHTTHTAAVKNRHRERYPRAKGLRVGLGSGWLPVATADHVCPLPPPLGHPGPSARVPSTASSPRIPPRAPRS